VKNGSAWNSQALIARGVEAPCEPTPRISRQTRRQFRELARRLHPDLAADPKEAEQRHEAMARATHAYRLNDPDGLRAILSEWESHPERVRGTDRGSRFLRAIRQSGWLRARIAYVQNELDSLRASPLADLMRRAREARAEGWSLLAEMQKRVDEQLAQAEEDLERVTEALSGLDGDTTRVIKVNAEMV
jgi:hypothetical protein